MVDFVDEVRQEACFRLACENKTRCHLCLGGGGRGSAALWAAEIGQPGTAVELAVAGLDLIWLEAVGGWRDDQSIETLHLLWAWVADPADEDGVARVPGLEDLEGHVGLTTLASKERSLGGKGCGAEREGAFCAAVDEGVDRVRLVKEVIGEDLLGELLVVVGDELGEVVTDDLGVRVAQAEGVTGLGPAVGHGGAGQEGRGPGEN